MCGWGHTGEEGVLAGSKRSGPRAAAGVGRGGQPSPCGPRVTGCIPGRGLPFLPTARGPWATGPCAVRAQAREVTRGPEVPLSHRRPCADSSRRPGFACEHTDGCTQKGRTSGALGAQILLRGPCQEGKTPSGPRACTPTPPDQGAPLLPLLPVHSGTSVALLPPGRVTMPWRGSHCPRHNSQSSDQCCLRVARASCWLLTGR